MTVRRFFKEALNNGGNEVNACRTPPPFEIPDVAPSLPDASDFRLTDLLRGVSSPGIPVP